MKKSLSLFNLTRKAKMNAKDNFRSIFNIHLVNSPQIEMKKVNEKSKGRCINSRNICKCNIQ